MQIGKFKIELKWYVVKYTKYKGMHWWNRPFKSYLTGFGYPNTGGPNSATRFMGGIYTESWDYRKCYRKFFDFYEANKILEFLVYGLNNDIRFNKFEIKPYYKFSWS